MVLPSQSGIRKPEKKKKIHKTDKGIPGGDFCIWRDAVEILECS